MININDIVVSQTSEIQQAFLNDKTKIVFLPKNLLNVEEKSQLVYPDTTRVIYTLLKNEGLDPEAIDVKIPSEQLNDVTWIGPTLLISYSLYSQNDQVVSITLSVIANYLTNFFLGFNGKKEVKIRMIAENRKGDRKEFAYEGPADKINDLDQIINTFMKK